MDDVVVLGWGSALHEGGGVFDGGDVVRGKVEVFGGELVHHRVEFHDGGLDAVVDQGRGGGADTEAAGGG